MVHVEICPLFLQFFLSNIIILKILAQIFLCVSEENQSLHTTEYASKSPWFWKKDLSSVWTMLILV